MLVFLHRNYPDARTKYSYTRLSTRHKAVAPSCTAPYFLIDRHDGERILVARIPQRAPPTHF
jgi:hypothetical protein